MKKYIDGMKEIKADDQLKNQIISSIKQREAKPAASFFTYKHVLSGVAVACALALFITLGIPMMGDRNHPNQAGPSGLQTLFQGFQITAYADDGTPVNVKPNLDFPVGKYQMTMSSVPGFPIKIDCDGADAIKLSVTDGSFLLWEPSDGQINEKGQQLEIKPGSTVYWEPVKATDHDNVVMGCDIEIRAYKNNQKLGSHTIKIQSDNNYTYTGRLSE